MRVRRTVNVRQMLDLLGRLRGLGIDFIRKSVDGPWGRPGDLVIGECGYLCASRTAILVGPKRCELYRVCVEIHQKHLEAVMVSTEWWGYP